ncbi:MAG: TIGR03087 family PEP-CTERM/XrtA system glycosyltransferase [Burkholderiaceae bacterium]|nr:TIGR03087 family PEP-CTERM/XrtA system glycosyltransferase [Burkholderiaceae bacterium]
MTIAGANDRAEQAQLATTPARGGGGARQATPNVLLLVHRIPFPPDKGDKIRSHHLLKHLAARYRVHLGAFVDDPADLAHETALRAICPDVRLFRIDPRARKLASLAGLLTGEPLSVRFYHDRRVDQWIEALRARERLDAVVVFSSTMAQFVRGPRWASTRRIADFVDVDSEKWRQYAARARGPSSWIFAREARTLLAFERHIAASFMKTLFVSAAEAALFVQRAPETAQRIGYFSNGVDTDFFDPAVQLADPYPPGGPVIVFTGAMDYRPNVEAVTWFAEQILPQVQEHRPEVRFWIVGSKPARAVKQLEQKTGVTVTGRVEDVRPYLRHANVAVAPLLLARGVQNKVLEALAMSRPVICTSAAAQGIESASDVLEAIEDEADGFARAVLRALDRNRSGDARRAILEGFSWSSHLGVVDRLIDTPVRLPTP